MDMTNAAATKTYLITVQPKGGVEETLETLRHRTEQDARAELHITLDGEYGVCYGDVVRLREQGAIDPALSAKIAGRSVSDPDVIAACLIARGQRMGRVLATIDTRA